MSLKIIYKHIRKMKKKGTLPELNIKTVETPFGNVEFLVFPLLQEPEVKQKAHECLKSDEELQWALRSDFGLHISPPERTKRPNMYDIVISDLRVNEAESLYEFLEKTLIKI